MKVCGRYDVTIGGAETLYTKNLCLFTSATDQGGLQYGDHCHEGQLHCSHTINGYGILGLLDFEQLLQDDRLGCS